MTGGLMIAASVVTSRALAPIEQVIGQWRGFVAARQAYQRIKRVSRLRAGGRHHTPAAAQGDADRCASSRPVRRARRSR